MDVQNHTSIEEIFQHCSLIASSMSWNVVLSGTMSAGLPMALRVMAVGLAMAAT